jgi:glycosyltransferase involved in cell wall biosynthesis
LLFNSRVSAEQHQAIGYDRPKTTIIPNGFDTARFAPNASARASLRSFLGAGDVPLIGLVARYEPVKGHLLFLRAVAQAIAQGRHCRAVLVGRHCDIENAELMRVIAALGIDGAVTLLGERRDVPELLSAFDIAVCPSLSESFPNAIGEAMACGLPCVVTDVGDCAHLVGETGLVSPSADPAAFAARLVEILDLDPESRSRLGAKARERIETHFSLRAVIGRYGDLYEKLALTRAKI